MSNQIKTARRTSYKLMGAGLHGAYGIGPDITKHLWSSIYVMPRFSYGLEALPLLPKEVKRLEDFYKSNLHAIQVMPKSTATVITYLLLGVPPFEVQLHILTITFFTNALRHEYSLEYSVIQHQLVMKDESARSWVWHIQLLLQRYRLPSAFELLHKPPSKEQ